MDENALAATSVATSDWSLGSCMLQMGGGFIAGVAVGYAMKVASKMVLLAMGALIVVMYMMMHAGFITVNWDAVGAGLETGTKAAGSMAWTMITELSSSFVGFAGGVTLGWKYR